jgi:hypothetical protein
MKRLLFTVIAVFFAVVAASAASLTVSWADGKIDMQQGSDWVAVNIGDQIDSSATLRLGKGASVELTAGKHKVSITSAGTYSLDSLLSKGAAAENRISALDKLGKLVDPKATTSSTTVAAVRGDAIEPTKEATSWDSGSANVSAILDQGRKLVRDGDFDGAAARFEEAVKASDGDTRDSATYSEAWALAAGDSNAKAVKLLRSMPDSGTWAGPKDLLLARLDIDSNARDEAKAVLTAGLRAKLFVGDDVGLANSLLTEASAQ